MERVPRSLSGQQALDLVGSGGVGRVGVSTDDGPRIFPVNYVVDHGTIVFRTAPDSELGRHCWGDRVAFEVDSIDTDRATAWSVVISGRAVPVEDAREIQLLETRDDLRPWAGGSRPLLVRISPLSITGRTITA